jgi:hypothetical protein
MLNFPPYNLGNVYPFEYIDVVDHPWGCALNVNANSNADASAVWPLAKEILYLPFRLPFPVLVKQLFVANGGTASGNLDLGIYSIAGTKLVNKGSTLQAGTTAIQLLDITDTQLGQGTFYFAITMDGTTGTTRRNLPASIQVSEALGILKETPGAFGLSATATFAACDTNYLPHCGLVIASA